jgi:probable addiction module antidote protein
VARKRDAGIVAFLRARMEVAGDDPATIAVEALYLALSTGGNPNFGTILKVTKALGLKLVPKAALLPVN